MSATRRPSTASSRAKVQREVRTAFAKYDKGKDGFIDEDDLTALLTDLQGKPASKTDVLFALKAMDSSGDGRISFGEMCEYWEQLKVGHGGGKFNKLLVKDLVGHTRLSSYDLPPAAFAYGATTRGDDIGAKQGAVSAGLPHEMPPFPHLTAPACDLAPARSFVAVLTSWNGREGESPRIGASWKPQPVVPVYGRTNR